MQTQVTARHFEADPNLREYASTRLTRLERYYDGITDAHVILSVDSQPASDKVAEITLNVFRQQLAAHNTAATHEEAIDGCVASLRRQIMKYKSKLRDTNQDSHR